MEPFGSYIPSWQNFEEWLKIRTIAFVYLTLLGAYLIILGMALAGWFSASIKRSKEAPWNHSN